MRQRSKPSGLLIPQITLLLPLLLLDNADTTGTGALTVSY